MSRACSQLCILPAKHISVRQHAKMASGPKRGLGVSSLREAKLAVKESIDSFGRHARIYPQFVSCTSCTTCTSCKSRTSACKRKIAERPTVGAEQVETNPKYSLHSLRKYVRHVSEEPNTLKTAVWRLVWKRLHLHAYRTRAATAETHGQSKAVLLLLKLFGHPGWWWGTAVAQWLRCCATNRKVAGSIPADVIGIFHWHKILPIAPWPLGRVSVV
jgi:hypothetical protein